MGAIGGLLDLRRCRGDADTVLRMSRSMLSRASCGRGGYISSEVCLFGQDLFEPLGHGGGQPAILTRGGHCYVAVLDGLLRGDGVPSGELYGISAARFILERYLSCGIDLLSSLQGAFALAIWDGYRGELILARDPLGRKPLFYASENGRFAFASQIKALFQFLGGSPAVDTERLRAHWLAPCGLGDGADLYREIEALPGGHCGIVSGLGLTVHSYGSVCAATAVPSSVPSVSSQFCPDRAGLIRCLEEALFAFDCPAFDDLMPAFFSFLDGCTCNGSVAIADPMLFRDIRYAWERADRLGAVRGLWVELVPPDGSGGHLREQRRMDRMLRELVDEVATPLLDRLFGSDWRRVVEQERRLSVRIRMRGILYQTLLWADRYSVLFA